MKKLKLVDACTILKCKQLSAEEIAKLRDESTDIALLPSSKSSPIYTSFEKAGSLASQGKVITMGKARYANIKYHEGYFISSNNVIIESFNENELLPKYLYYFLMFNSKKCYSDGATYPKFDSSLFKKLEINIVPIEEQKKVVKIFDELFELIAKNNKLISAQNEFKETVLHEMVGSLSSTKYNIVPFESVMERCVDIGSNGSNETVMKHLKMKNDRDYAFVVRFTNLSNNDFNKDVRYIEETEYEFFSKSKIYGGEIIFCKIGSAGQNYIMPNIGMPATLGLNQIMITPKNISTQYLYSYINSQDGKRYIDSNVNGAVTKTITKHALWKMPIILPPVEIQQQFETIAEQIENTKILINKRIESIMEIISLNMTKFYSQE